MKNSVIEQTANSGGGGIVNIYGNDKNVAQWGWTFFLTKPLFAIIGGKFVTQTTLYKPATQTAIEALIGADAFYFWGHGGKNGSLKLSDGEYLRIPDILKIAEAREKAGKEKMSFIHLDACDTADTADTVNSWLKLTKKFIGVPGLTWYAKFGLFGYGKRLKTSTPIDYNPGEKLKGKIRDIE